MCFEIYKDKLQEQVSSEDIVVYKTGTVSGNGFFPRFMNDFMYFPNKLCPKEELEVREAGKTTNIHVSDDRVASYSKIWVAIDRGYHSYKTLRATIESFKTMFDVGMFIIPKGSKYYYNEENQQYVSETIIYIKHIKYPRLQNFILQIKQVLKILTP